MAVPSPRVTPLAEDQSKVILPGVVSIEVAHLQAAEVEVADGGKLQAGTVVIDAQLYTANVIETGNGDVEAYLLAQLCTAITDGEAYVGKSAAASDSHRAVLRVKADILEVAVEHLD